jgi:hypothetical protein
MEEEKRKKISIDEEKDLGQKTLHEIANKFIDEGIEKMLKGEEIIFTSKEILERFENEGHKLNEEYELHKAFFNFRCRDGELTGTYLLNYLLEPRCKEGTLKLIKGGFSEHDSYEGKSGYCECTFKVIGERPKRKEKILYEIIMPETNIELNDKKLTDIVKIEIKDEFTECANKKTKNYSRKICIYSKEKNSETKIEEIELK